MEHCVQTNTCLGVWQEPFFKEADIETPRKDPNHPSVRTVHVELYTLMSTSVECRWQRRRSWINASCQWCWSIRRYCGSERVMSCRGGSRMQSPYHTATISAETSTTCNGRLLVTSCSSNQLRFCWRHRFPLHLASDDVLCCHEHVTQVLWSAGSRDLLHTPFNPHC